MNSEQDFCKVQSQDGFELMRKAFDLNRFPQSCIVVSHSKSKLDECCSFFAKKFLGENNPLNGINYHKLCPIGVMRQIPVEDVRELIKQVQTSPLVGSLKFVIIEMAECLNSESGNAILKIIEEPPSDTTILLTTHKYYDILPTIRSRCFVFRLHGDEDVLLGDDFELWMNEYISFLNNIHAKLKFKKAALILNANKLIVDLADIVDKFAAKVEDTSSKREIQTFALKSISDTTLKFIKKDLKIPLINAIEYTEQSRILLDFNMPFQSVLEKNFLSILSDVI